MPEYATIPLNPLQETFIPLKVSTPYVFRVTPELPLITPLPIKRLVPEIKIGLVLLPKSLLIFRPLEAL